MQVKGVFFTTTALLSLSLLMGLSSRALADTYKVDPVHSSVLFRVKHLGVGYFYARFTDVAGTFTVDEANPAKSAVEIQVKSESVDTHDPRRDQHLQSPDFLNAKQFPVITFKSKGVKKVGKDAYQVTGDLTLHGVTRPLTVKVAHTGAGRDPRGTYRVGFETIFNIKRSDFGMKYMLQGVSDEVRLIVSVEGIRQ